MVDFKVGDRVKVIDKPLNVNKEQTDTHDAEYSGQFGFLAECIDEGAYWRIKFDSGEDTQHIWTHNLVSAKGKQKPPKPAKFVVIWDETSGDPHKFFASLSDANKFIKELLERSEVIKESITLIEIKSMKKMKVRTTTKMELVK